MLQERFSHFFLRDLAFRSQHGHGNISNSSRVITNMQTLLKMLLPQYKPLLCYCWMGD